MSIGKEVEAYNTLTTIRGKRRHLLDKRTGFALCGAGQPNIQFPLGSGIRGQGRGWEEVTCYKCLKLNYINDLEDVQAIPTRDFQPTDLTPLKTEVSPKSYERRRKHIMIPFGIEGMFGAEMPFDNENKIKEKMIEKIDDDSGLNQNQKNEFKKRLEPFDRYLAQLKLGLVADIEIWTKYSPFRVGNKSHRQKPLVKMRTQRPPVTGPLADINYSTLNVEPSEKETVSARRKREKHAKLHLLKMFLKLSEMMKQGQKQKLYEIAKRKDKIGRMAKRILFTEDLDSLLVKLNELVQDEQKIANPNRQLAYDSMRDFEEQHSNRRPKQKVRINRGDQSPPKPKFVVRNINQGLQVIKHPDITSNWRKSLRIKPTQKTAVLIPCASTKPFPNAPSHKHGYLEALKGKSVDIYVVSEPLGIVPYSWSKQYPNNAYDFPPKYLKGDARSLLINRFRKWDEKVGHKYKKIYLALPNHHMNLIKDADINGIDVSISVCRQKSCSQNTFRATSDDYINFLRKKIR